MKRFGNKILISTLIVLFHAVGLVGFLVPSAIPLFLKLVPFHLLLMATLLVLTHHGKNKEFGLFLLVTYLAGYLIEVLGVSTGLIFGRYTYGETLGIKLADVPILIGVNWIILTYSTGMAIKYLKIRNHLVRALIGALFMVFLDILIEPVAIRFDYWSWEGMNIPFQNYVAWFLFSFCLLLFFFARKFRTNNPTAIAMLLSQTLFFLVLNYFA